MALALQVANNLKNDRSGLAGQERNCKKAALGIDGPRHLG